MKLPIKKKYFDLIKSGKKKVEYRDAHFTLICEETKEQLRVNVIAVDLMNIGDTPSEIRKSKVIKDQTVICFWIKKVNKK